MFEVLILSLLQGVAEFLPISSSGHLAIGQHLLGLDMPGMRLEVCLHAGTLVSVCLFYRKTLARLLCGCFSPGATKVERATSWWYAVRLAVSALPAVAVYFLFRERIESSFSSMTAIGIALIFTGVVLFATRFLPRGSSGVGLPTALFMGLGQAIAILPGVSRSGMTLACARTARADPEKSAEFSFLMCAPLILGGLVLEIVKCFDSSAAAGAGDGWGELAIGMVVSAIVGYYSLKLLVSSLKGRWFWIFGPYCVLAGLATLIFT